MLRPLSNRVLILPDATETVTPGGLALPDSSQRRNDRGTVIAVGPGPMLKSGGRARPSFSPGDRVLFSAYEGTIVELDDGSEATIIDCGSVVGVLDRSAA